MSELFVDEEGDEEPFVEGKSQPLELPVPTTEAEREQLAQANEGRHDWLARDGAPDRTIKRASYQRRSDFEASTTDPDAALMRRKGGGLHFGYSDHDALGTRYEQLIRAHVADLFGWRSAPAIISHVEVSPTCVETDCGRGLTGRLRY